MDTAISAYYVLMNADLTGMQPEPLAVKDFLADSHRKDIGDLAKMLIVLGWSLFGLALLVGYPARKGNESAGASKRQVFSLGYDYDLSQRTDAYLMVRNDKIRVAGAAVEATGTSYGGCSPENG